MNVDPTKLNPLKFSLIDEFKKFAFKGNMIDMAVGIVIGAAFGKVVESLVKNVVMQLVAVIFSLVGGAPNYAGWVITLNGVPIQIGVFVGEFISFLVTAFAVFIFIVKFLGFITKKKAEEAAAPPPPPPPTRDQELLSEIRDLLKTQK